MSKRRIGLALSGGGFRAAAFHLGVLKRLEELRVLSQVDLLSTVSGGSITGALYALRCRTNGSGDPGSFPVQELIDEITPTLQTNLRGRALFGSPVRVVRTLASFGVPKVRRTPLLVAELDRQLFHGARLADLPPWIAVNATNLATGKNWRFFADRAGDFLVGATDQTQQISVAEAVGASAAYPGLTDPFPLRTRWENLRPELLDDRWQRPPAAVAAQWRERHGRAEGPVVLPLVDGGVYDNDGANALRGARVTHAIVSTASPGESSSFEHAGVRTLLRLVGVMHSRLGAASRQLTHEMTHGTHPTRVRQGLRAIADRLRTMESSGGELHTIAGELDQYAEVGWPPRGHQFSATAPIILFRDDLAQNVSAGWDPPYDVPPAYRGLPAALVPSLAGVRTDLDALGGTVTNLLIAQGYYLCDLHVRVAMRDLVADALADPQSQNPDWKFASEAVSFANSNAEQVAGILAAAAVRSWFGRA